MGGMLISLLAVHCSGVEPAFKTTYAGADTKLAEIVVTAALTTPSKTT